MRRSHFGAFALILAALALGALPLAAQQTFATPQEAAKALVDAAARNDTAALLKLFGPQGKDIVDYGDAAEEQRMRASFAHDARERLDVEPEPFNPNRATLAIGAKSWPFPVPLVRKNGQWRFDATQGRMEILARRVGRHELAAIDVCRAYVEAQMEYAKHDYDHDGVLQYAQKIVGSAGKKDGLYWAGEPDNLVPKAFADAAAAMLAQGGKPVPYHGYYFHILKAQGVDAQGGALDYVVKGKMIGGFALVAYPAEYGVSGVQTFIVSHHGMVYAKDLGRTTAALAPHMVHFNPDKTWKPVEGE